MFITYELPQVPIDKATPSTTQLGAKEVKIEGRVVRWKVGEFHHASGKHVYGVQISSASTEEENVEHHLVELPENAQNVQIHLEQLPEKYRPALKNAA